MQAHRPLGVRVRVCDPVGDGRFATLSHTPVNPNAREPEVWRPGVSMRPGASLRLAETGGFAETGCVATALGEG